MKKLLILPALLALSCFGLHAQTNTNAFIVPLGTNITVQPAITESSVTVDRVVIDNVSQQAVIFLHGVNKPTILKGTDFVNLKAVLGPVFKPALATYLQAHPPAP